MTDPFAAPAPGSVPPTPQTPLYGEPLRGPMRNGLGTAALILGLFGWLIVPGILAIVFGVRGMRRARRGEASNHGVALAGTILGAITLALGAMVLVLVVRVVTSDAFDQFRDCIEAAPTQEQRDQCVEDFANEMLNNS